MVEAAKPDVICLQEIKALESDVPTRRDRGKMAPYHPAEKKGYAGTALIASESRSRAPGLRHRLDRRRGPVFARRFRQFVGDLFYVPSGSSSEEAQAKKFRFMKEFLPFLKAFEGDRTRTGDRGRLEHRAQGNRSENWKSNQKNLASRLKSVRG